MNVAFEGQSERGADLVVLSDLHLGEGIREDEPRYAPTEDFFQDVQFERFLRELKRRYAGNPSGLRLVLNGDTFDFLTVTATPRDEEDAGFKVSPMERKFGLNPTEKKSVYKLDVIVRGHRIFFRALADFVASGFRVEMLSGNHDFELYFNAVRERLLFHLVRLDGALDRDTAAKRVTFHNWFYLEPGRLYIEHGNQYDAGNSIRYPFNPVLKNKRRPAEDEEMLDYPLGSIFVRFFYNRVRRLDPYSPRLVSFDHYLSFIKRYNLFDVWKVYKDHYPHFIAALGSSSTAIGSSGSTGEDDARQAAVFEAVSKRYGHPNLLESLSALKNSSVSASKVNVAREMMSAFFRRGFRLFVVAFVTIFVWVGILQLIDMVPGITVTAFLLALFAVATIVGALTVWIHLDRKLRRKDTISAPIRLLETARKIAEVANVRMVLMGHTHMVDYRRIANGHAVYANSGTWTSIDNPWSRFMRDARRLTFLHVRGDYVHLKRWNDDAGRFDSVPLFDLPDATGLDQLPSESAFDLSSTGRVSIPPSPAYVQDEDDFED